MPEAFKILITDDDGDLRELLTEAVRNWGYATDVAMDGDEALRRMQRQRYDTVIRDKMMLGMDGLTLLKRIKDLDREILVIIITGYATIETAVKAIEIGAYDYIAKPFRLDELMIVIKNACERLRLTVQNRALLEELRTAHAEVARLKNVLVQSGIKLPEQENLPANEAIVYVPSRTVFSHDGERVFVGDFTGKVRVWALKDNQPVGELTTNPG